MSSFYNFKVTPYGWHEMNGLYVIDNPFFISMDGGERHYTFKIHRGFMTDGGSIPKIFSWFAKGWSKDYRYNAAYILHDWLYASGILERDVADDVLRSALRDCGMNRFHASTICWAVNNFAKGHYGRMNDDLDCAGYGELVSIRPTICSVLTHVNERTEALAPKGRLCRHELWDSRHDAP